MSEERCQNGIHRTFCCPTCGERLTGGEIDAVQWHPGDVVWDEDCRMAFLRSNQSTWLSSDGAHHHAGEFIERCRVRPLVLAGRAVAA